MCRSAVQEISLGSMCRARWAVGPSEFLAAHEATAVTLTCQAHSIQVHMLPERRRSLALARAMIVAGLPLAQRTALARQLRQRWSLADRRAMCGRVLQLVIEEFVRPSASAALAQSSPALHSPLCPPLVCVRWCGSCIRCCAAWPLWTARWSAAPPIAIHILHRPRRSTCERQH